MRDLAQQPDGGSARAGSSAKRSHLGARLRDNLSPCIDRTTAGNLDEFTRITKSSRIVVRELMTARHRTRIDMLLRLAVASSYQRQMLTLAERTFTPVRDYAHSRPLPYAAGATEEIYGLIGRVTFHNGDSGVWMLRKKRTRTGPVAQAAFSSVLRPGRPSRSCLSLSNCAAVSFRCSAHSWPWRGRNPPYSSSRRRASASMSVIFERA